MKLKSNELAELKRLCPGNKVPTYPDPKSNGIYEVEASIQDALDKERMRKGLKHMSPLRRAFYGLSTLNMYFKGDGLAIGVAVNDPELLTAAIEGCKAMKRPKAAMVLEQAARAFPPKTLWKSLRKREAWFATAAGEKAAAKLEALEDKLDEAEGSNGFVECCIRFALKNPTEFFEATPSKKSS